MTDRKSSRQGHYVPETKTAVTVHNVPDGQVKVQQHVNDGEWLMVELGRARYTKRFNLRRSEASELVDRLAELGIEKTPGDESGPGSSLA